MQVRKRDAEGALSERAFNKRIEVGEIHFQSFVSPRIL